MTTDAADRIARLERQVELLLARVETLETENAELRRRLGENSANSSKPPSTDSPADRHARPKDAPSGNPRGGQRGHKGHRRSFLQAQIELLLDEGAALPIKGFQGACRNILEHRDALWRFVSKPGVDPTNNHAERELRDLVCWRRSTGGSRSDRGDLFAANLKSVIHTCRKHHRHVLTYLNSAIHAALRGRKTPSLIAAA